MQFSYQLPLSNLIDDMIKTLENTKISVIH